MLYNPMLFEHQYKNKLSRPMNVTFAVSQAEEVSHRISLSSAQTTSTKNQNDSSHTPRDTIEQAPPFMYVSLSSNFNAISSLASCLLRKFKTLDLKDTRTTFPMKLHSIIDFHSPPNLLKHSNFHFLFDRRYSQIECSTATYQNRTMMRAYSVSFCHQNTHTIRSKTKMHTFQYGVCIFGWVRVYRYSTCHFNA